MYQLSFLPILVFVLACFILYNEYYKKLNNIEMLAIAVCFIALIKASYNYIKLENLNRNSEGFGNRNRNSKRRKSNFQNKKKNNQEEENNETFENKTGNETGNETDDKYDMIINSEDAENYLDIEKENMYNTSTNNNATVNTTANANINNNPINKDAVKSIDELLGIGSNKDFFSDVPNTTFPNAILPETKDDIKSVFSPKIIIGKQNRFSNTEKENKWNSAFLGDEFDVKEDADLSKDKKCAKYSRNTDEDETDNLIIKDYKDAKKWHPGYTYLPPSNWDVPQKYPPVCMSKPNVFQLTGLVDRGLPLNVLELNPQGKVANTENSVHLTNVGSMLPKFSYEEMPFSKPYV